ncbi:hypothetical protein BCAR13_1710022 [Paraburkholderia caribensis]|nr:hypothetical protein BCAR13_1710022 [Paraburkholderia caribensis]
MPARSQIHRTATPEARRQLTDTTANNRTKPDRRPRRQKKGKKSKKKQKKPGLDRGNDTLFNVSERLAAWPLKSRPCGAVHTASHFDSASRGCAPTDDGASVDTQVKPDPLKPLHRYQTAAFLAEAAVREA